MNSNEINGSVEQKNQNEENQIRHQNDVKAAFANYSADMRKSYSKIYDDQKLNKYFTLLRDRKREKMEMALQANQKFLNAVLESTYSSEMGQPGQRIQAGQNITNCHNVSKMRTTVKQFFREWCQESPEIKDYVALVEKTQKYLKKGDRVLAPGSGLARLVLELVEAGFAAQGNQVTYFMLFGSNFILNCVEEKEQYEIYPFIHSANNHQNEDNMFRSVRVPDKLASSVVLDDADFSMAAGQFTEIYEQEKEGFDGIVTCFFLDTANNIFTYVDTIFNTLKADGIWVNLGPLLYHYKDMLDQISVEISCEQLVAYIKLKGFKEEESEEWATTYCHDPLSTYKHVYKCEMSVWRKTGSQGREGKDKSEVE